MNKMLKIAALVVSLLVVILIGLAPIGPMPGVFIGGTQTATPAVWGNTSAEHEIRLKVPGTIPRVVIIWVIQYENDLYFRENAPRVSKAPAARVSKRPMRRPGSPATSPALAPSFSSSCHHSPRPRQLASPAAVSVAPAGPAPPRRRRCEPCRHRRA